MARVHHAIWMNLMLFFSFLFICCFFHFYTHVMHSQQNRERVTQAYFEIPTIEVGIVMKNNSSVNFEIVVFLHTLIWFLSPPCNFWLIFKHFPTKNSPYSAAYHIQNYKNKKL